MHTKKYVKFSEKISRFSGLFSKVDKILQIYFSTSGVNAIREPHTEVRPLNLIISSQHLKVQMFTEIWNNDNLQYPVEKK